MLARVSGIRTSTLGSAESQRQGRRSLSGARDLALFAMTRLVYGLAVLLGVTTLAFALIHLSGDPVAALAPPGASPEDQAVLRARFALDEPLPIQYAAFLGRAVRGDFGDSWSQRRPALTAVGERLPATLALTGAALGIALLIGVPLGMAASTGARGWPGALATLVALLGQAIPGFWLGTMLILAFAVDRHWFPSSGLDGPRSLVLPALTLAAYPLATVVRLLRASLAETVTGDFVLTARAKGLEGRVVLRRHALPNAALPALAYVGLQTGFLLGGAVVVEAVFAYPGIGRLALQAVADRDLPLIQAIVVTVAALIVVVNLTIDLIAAWMDPRARSGGAA
ncbi:MAG TPA: ABC transporter permease [Thermomicrobiales bacterium]|nr:ABC transporter permease [Thermomicrobiales bacterium]